MSISNYIQNENANLRRELLLKQEMGDMVMRDIDTGAFSANEVADKFGLFVNELADTIWWICQKQIWFTFLLSIIFQT